MHMSINHLSKILCCDRTTLQIENSYIILIFGNIEAFHWRMDHLWNIAFYHPSLLHVKRMGYGARMEATALSYDTKDVDQVGNAGGVQWG